RSSDLVRRGALIASLVRNRTIRPKPLQVRTGSGGHHSHSVDPNDPFDGVENELFLPPQAYYYFSRILFVTTLIVWLKTYRDKAIDQFSFKKWVDSLPEMTIKEEEIYLDEWEDWEAPQHDVARLFPRYTKKFRKADDWNFGATVW
uniref:NDUFB2 n=1 Tax=Euglena gracilis TaxID=3039 RepID=UPI002FE4FAD6